MNSYLDAFRKFADFSGRSRRRDYWLFALFSSLVSIVLLVLDVSLGMVNLEVGVGLLSGIYSLAVLIPGFAVTVRRLHDTDHSGWWLLIAIVPLIGPIILLVFFLRDSQPGSNRFGPNPKHAKPGPMVESWS